MSSPTCSSRPTSVPTCAWSCTVFQGFGPEVFEWFAGLERDNSKAYFTATRDLYEHAVRGGLEAMLDELAMSSAARRASSASSATCASRPTRRPTRRAPTGSSTARRCRAPASTPSSPSSGLYAGTGYYRLARDQLERFRAAVADDAAGARLEAVTAAAQDAGLELAGQSLRTAPRGYPRDHPRIELLRRKALIAGRALAGEGGIDRDAALDHVAGAWRAAEPLNAWLDEHVGPSTLPREPRGGRR